MKRIAVLFVALIVALGLAMSCASGPSQEEIATDVAKSWTEDSIDDVSNTVVELVVGESPLLSQIAGNILAEQVHNKVEWSYSTPNRKGEDKYQLTATGSVTLSVELPLLGTKTFVASMPFILTVNTESESVENWSLDALSAMVAEQNDG